MKKIKILTLVFMLVASISQAQTTAMQFSGPDCNGNPVDLFADLDAEKAVVLFFFMPSCTSCPPPAQKIQAMANNINAMYPGKVKGYAFPYQNSTLCSYSSAWVSSSGVSALYAPMNNGASHVAHYGGFGMPTVVLLAGADHRVMFSTLSFSTSDTTIMRDSIMAFINSTTTINELPSAVSSFSVFPNPANANVSININLKESSNLKMDVADITGKMIAVIMDEKQNGLVTKEYNVAELPNGNYLIRLNANGQTVTRKIAVKH